MFSYNFFNSSCFFIDISGFLKKLPALPISLGSGSLLLRILIIAFETSLIVGDVIFISANSKLIAP